MHSLIVQSEVCASACWWGIVPGKTLWREASELLDSIGLKTSVKQQAADSVTYGAGYQVKDDNGSLYNVWLSFAVADGMVNEIHVRGEAYGGRSSELLAQDWGPYSLDRILTALGAPQEEPAVTFVDPLEGGAPPFYSLALRYRNCGFGVSYTGTAASNGEVFRACPRLDEALSVRLDFFSPESAGGSETPRDSPPLRELIGIDAESFYRTFKDADSRVCLESPVDIWPIH